jgi:hypothetical protein
MIAPITVFKRLADQESRVIGSEDEERVDVRNDRDAQKRAHRTEEVDQPALVTFRYLDNGQLFRGERIGSRPVELSGLARAPDRVRHLAADDERHVLPEAARHEGHGLEGEEEREEYREPGVEVEG